MIKSIITKTDFPPWFDNRNSTLVKIGKSVARPIIRANKGHHSYWPSNVWLSEFYD